MTPRDVQFTLDWLSASGSRFDSDDIDSGITNDENSSEILSHFGNLWRRRIASTWSIETHDFWTLPNAFRRVDGGGGKAGVSREGMAGAAPDLYQTLSSSDLALFKGDLNYRKLVGDLDWETTTPFQEALGDFRPTRIVALRTLKANVVSGLKPGYAARLSEEAKDWMTSGKHAVIQMS